MSLNRQNALSTVIKATYSIVAYNDPSSAILPAGRTDCNRDAPPGSL